MSIDISHTLPENICTKSGFEKDVAEHKMNVIRDDGVYRHIEFKPPQSFRWFGIITWPGHLTYYGDMGYYTFTRLNDMFQFFRGDDTDNDPSWSYWAEKLRAVDAATARGHTGMDGVFKWSPALFRHNVDQDWKEYLDSYTIGPDLAQEVWEEISDTVLDKAEDGPEVAVRAAVEYYFKGDDGHFIYPFREFYEYSNREFEYRFLWCCRALRWAVSQYDAAKTEPQTQETHV